MGVERAAESTLIVEVGIRKLKGHVVALLDAYAMLSAQHSAGGKRGLDDLSSGLVNPVKNTRIASVERQDWMQGGNRRWWS